MKDFIRGHAIVEIMPGSSIDRAAMAAINLAQDIRGTVYFKFNGCELSASPGSAQSDITKRYYARLEYEGLLQSLNEKASCKHLNQLQGESGPAWCSDCGEQL